MSNSSVNATTVCLWLYKAANYPGEVSIKRILPGILGIIKKHRCINNRRCHKKIGIFDWKRLVLIFIIQIYNLDSKVLN